MPRKHSWTAACAAVLALNAAGVYPTLAEETGIKESAHKAGRAIGSGTREAWHGTKKVGKEIGHGFAKAGKAVGGAAKEGAREFKRAIKGEK